MLNHRKTSLVPDGSDTGEIQPISDWNDQHLFSGGALGSLLYRDTSDPAGGHSWLAATSVGKFLRSAGVGAVPAWSTMSWEDSASVGDILVATSANIIGSLAAAAAGHLLRAAGATSVPAWSTLTMPDTVVHGDLLTASADNVLAALAAVAVGQVLASAGVNTPPAWSASPSLTNLTLSTALNLAPGNGAQWTKSFATELLTLSTVTTFTDTAANLLPANAIIESVVARVTVAIATATAWSIGDSNMAARFAPVGSTLTLGSTAIGVAHVNQPDPTGGPVQVAAAKVRISTTGTPSAGQVRVTVFYRQLTAPTS